MLSKYQNTESIETDAPIFSRAMKFDLWSKSMQTIAKCGECLTVRTRGQSSSDWTTVRELAPRPKSFWKMLRPVDEALGHPAQPL